MKIKVDWYWRRVFGLGVACERWLQTSDEAWAVLRWHVHVKVFLLIGHLNINATLWRHHP